MKKQQECCFVLILSFSFLMSFRGWCGDTGPFYIIKVKVKKGCWWWLMTVLHRNIRIISKRMDGEIQFKTLRYWSVYIVLYSFRMLNALFLFIFRKCQGYQCPLNPLKNLTLPIQYHIPRRAHSGFLSSNTLLICSKTANLSLFDFFNFIRIEMQRTAISEIRFYKITHNKMELDPVSSIFWLVSAKSRSPF